MARAIILTGGNVGDVKTRLQNAQRLINHLCSGCAVSVWTSFS